MEESKSADNLSLNCIQKTITYDSFNFYMEVTLFKHKITMFTVNSQDDHV